MEKKLICLAVTMLLVVAVCSGEMKYYSDWETGYKGYALADYMGSTVTKSGEFSTFDELVDHIENLVKKYGLKKIVRYGEKLPKLENFLIWSALNEYDYEEGELYFVGVLFGDADAVGFFCVCITNNGKSCKWYGFKSLL